MLINLQGIALILVILAIAIKLAPRGVPIAGHEAGQLFLLAALPLFFIDFGTSAEYAAGELHHILAQADLQEYAAFADLAIALLNIAFGGLYIYALGVFRDGGGADTASMRYLGPMVAIMVAFLLLEDYTLTIVVSSLSGADQLLSSINALAAGPTVHILLGIGIAWLTCWLTLRGRRDASRITFIVLFTYATLMLITFVSLGLQTLSGAATRYLADGGLEGIRPWVHSLQGLGPYGLPKPDAHLPIQAIIGVVVSSVMHGLVALTGLEAVSNGLNFIKNEDANYVKWGKKRLPQLGSIWNFFSGRVGSGRTIQFGFLFWGGITTTLNSSFSNYFNVIDGTNGRTLPGNLAYLGLLPLGGVLLFAFRQIWSSLTLSFANMTAYEDMQSMGYRDGARGLLPQFFMYRSPNGNFPRPVLLAFGVATLIMILCQGNTSAAVPFYGIGVFAPISFMGFAVSRHLRITKPNGYRLSSTITFVTACLAVFIFISQIVGKFEEGGWIRLISFSSLYVTGHLILISDGGKRTEDLMRHLIYDVARIEGTMAELLTWQTHMMQTYRHNLRERAKRFRSRGKVPMQLAAYPPYQLHYDHH